MKKNIMKLNDQIRVVDWLRSNKDVVAKTDCTTLAARAEKALGIPVTVTNVRFICNGLGMEYGRAHRRVLGYSKTPDQLGVLARAILKIADDLQIKLDGENDLRYLALGQRGQAQLNGVED